MRKGDEDAPSKAIIDIRKVSPEIFREFATDAGFEGDSRADPRFDAYQHETTNVRMKLLPNSKGPSKVIINRVGAPGLSYEQDCEKFTETVRQVREKYGESSGSSEYEERDRISGRYGADHAA